MSTSQPDTVMEKKEFVISRTFNAPLELVYKAWTEADRLAQWWGPKGFSLRVIRFDFREGGEFFYSMQPKAAAGNANEMFGLFEYQEITAPRGFTFVNSFANDAGASIRNPFMPTWPLKILNRLTLTEANGKTTVTLRGGPLDATEEEIATFIGHSASLEQGFAGTWSQLDEYLASIQ